MTTELERDRKASERLRESVGTVRDDLKELGGVAREAAREKLDEARVATREAVTHGRERAESELDRLAHYVRERPVQSLAIALGVGLVVGALLSRRR